MGGRRGSIKEETEGEKEVAREEGGRLKERKSFMYYFGIMKISLTAIFPSAFTFIYIFSYLELCFVISCQAAADTEHMSGKIFQCPSVLYNLRYYGD